MMTLLVPVEADSLQVYDVDIKKVLAMVAITSFFLHLKP